MLWLVWHMWILIGLAFAGGVIAGWIIRARSDETPDRPMLEKLDATVVAPVHPVAEPEPAREPDAAAEAELEPAPKPETGPTPEPEPAPAPQRDAGPVPEPASEASSKSKAGSRSKTRSAAKPQVETSPPAAAPGEGDDLTRIKGLGPKAAAALKGEGVVRFAQIAAWKKADVDRFDALINGRGRIVRDDWVKQAKDLANG